MSGRFGPARRSAVVAAATLAALVAQPLVATPSYAGAACDSPVPLPGDDCTAPETKIAEKPAVDGQSETESRDASFAFTTEQAEPDVTFECRLEGPSQAHTWSDCTTPPADGATTSSGARSYTGLGLGTYTFSVRATDAYPLGPNTEQTPATFTWTIVEPQGPPPDDGEDPETTITEGADRWWPFSFLGITYASDEETSAWECSLNGNERACDGDRFDVYNMKAGDYLFQVAAVDTSGNVDPTPAKERWTVPMNNTLLKTQSEEWEQESGRGYFQDSYSIADERGAYIEQAKRGFRSLVLVATRCPECGKVAVSLKGERLRTVDLSAPETDKRQIIPIASWAKQQSGRVRIEVLTSGKDVLVEGLGFSGRR